MWPEGKGVNHCEEGVNHCEEGAARVLGAHLQLRRHDRVPVDARSPGDREHRHLEHTQWEGVNHCT